MPYIHYGKLVELVGTPIIGKGSCVALIQHYTPQVGHTSTWKQGDRVVDVAAKLQAGTVIATFENGKWPGRDHNNHAAYFLYIGKDNIYTKEVETIIVVDQYQGLRAVQAREIKVKHLPMNANGTWDDPSNNADAFYVVEP